MRKYKKDKRHKATAQEFSSPPSTIELPEDYIINEGFLLKGDTPISLITTGLIETAKQGFLHVDKTEKYKTE